MGRYAIGIISLLALFGALGLFYSQNKPIDERVSATKNGALAPAINLPTIDGGHYQLSQDKGKVVLINFWASWCPPCITELPSLARAHQKLKSKGFTVIAVSLDETIKPATQVLHKIPLPFPVLLDFKGEVARQYLVYGLPYTVLVDRAGKIQLKLFGEQVWDKGELFKKIEELL